MSVLLTPLFSCFVAGMAGLVVKPTQVDERLAAQAFERETAVATGLGLVQVDEQTVEVEGDVHELAFEAGPGECVAVVGTAWGPGVIEAVRIDRASDGVPLARADSPEGLTGHAQWCASGPAALRARLDVYHRDTVFNGTAQSSVRLRYAILRGRPSGGVTALNRGTLTLEGVVGIDRAAVVAAADRLASGLPSLGPELPIGDYRARLVPEDAALYAALVERATNGSTDAVRPTIDALPPSVPPGWRPLAQTPAPTPASALLGTLAPGTESPAVAFVHDSARRVLAVVDPSRLGAPCVTVQLVRMTYGFRAPVERVEQGSSHALARDQNVSWERVCAAAGPRVYVTHDTDRAPYLLRLFGG